MEGGIVRFRGERTMWGGVIVHSKEVGSSFVQSICSNLKSLLAFVFIDVFMLGSNAGGCSACGSRGSEPWGGSSFVHP